MSMKQNSTAIIWMITHCWN